MKIRYAVIASVFILAFSLAAHAQSSFTGRITDTSGKPLAGVLVEASFATGTGELRAVAVKSDANGNYVLAVHPESIRSASGVRASTRFIITRARSAKTRPF